MVTIGILALLLPASQGKHLPRSKLQSTIPPGLAGIGPGICIGSSQYLSDLTILTTLGPPVKLPTVF